MAYIVALRPMAVVIFNIFINSLLAMNKFSKALLLLLALIAIVACSNEVDEPVPQPSDKEVAIEVVSLVHDSVEVSITPKDESTLYYAFLHPDTEAFMGRDELEIYVDIRYGDYFEMFLTSGKQCLTFQGLIGHSHYKVVYFEYDKATGNKVGDVIFSERITTPDAPELFDIDVTDIKGMSAVLNITPPNNETTYYYYLYPVADYEKYQHGSDYELMQYDYSFWQYMAAIYEKPLDEVIANDLVQGAQRVNTDALLYLAEWNTQYIAWAYGITPDGQVTTPITRRCFTTASPASSSMSFEAENIKTEWYEQTTSEGTIRGYVAQVDIIPSSKNERYFATITNKDWYDWYASENNTGRCDEQYIMYQILLNASKPSSQLDEMCHEGNFTYNCFEEREILLRPDREYALFVFGMDDNGATTGLSVFPFTTGAMPQ